jgi:hypothetical protein
MKKKMSPAARVRKHRQKKRNGNGNGNAESNASGDDARSRGGRNLRAARVGRQRWDGLVFRIVFNLSRGP